MNERDLFRAIGDVSDDLIEEAGHKRSHLRIYLSTAVAACLCIVVLTAASGLFSDKKADSALADNAQRYCTPDGMPVEAAETTGAGDHLFSEAYPSADADAAGRSENPAYSYNAMPQDFSFHLLWSGQEYDSSTQNFTDSSGNTVSLLLKQEELTQIWMLLSGLEVPERTAVDGDISLRFTENGQTHLLTVSISDSGAALSICQELIRIVETAVQRIY